MAGTGAASIRLSFIVERAVQPMAGRRHAAAACVGLAVAAAAALSGQFELDVWTSKDRTHGYDRRLRLGTKEVGPAARRKPTSSMRARLPVEVLRRGEQGHQPAVGKSDARGARGTVTPIAIAYTQDGLTCRDFLASYVMRQRRNPGCRAKPAAKARRLGSRTFKPWKS